MLHLLLEILLTLHLLSHLPLDCASSCVCRDYLMNWSPCHKSHTLKASLCCVSSYVPSDFDASRTSTYSLAGCKCNPHFPCASGCALSAGLATWTPSHTPVLGTSSRNFLPIHSSIFTLEESHITYDTGILENTKCSSRVRTRQAILI
jgi:hypothetical protein